MKKSIQIDAMKRDDAQRKVKTNTGITPRIEKLIDYLYEITNIRFKTEEIRNFCNEYPESNFEDLKIKLKLNYCGIFPGKASDEKSVHSIKSKKLNSTEFENGKVRMSSEEWSSISFENNNIKVRSQFADTTVSDYVNNFIEKWILLCYSMSNGDKTPEKYIKFLRLVAKKSLEYGTSVRCDWENKKIIKISEKPLNDIEKTTLKFFEKKELSIEILNKVEEILNFENPQKTEMLDKDLKDTNKAIKSNTRRIKIISVGRDWAKGKDLDYNEKSCSIKLNKFFIKEEAQRMIGEEVMLNCEVLLYRNKFGFIRVNVFPLGKNMESSEISLNWNDEILKRNLKILQGKFALEENRERGLIFSYGVLMELVRRKPLSKNELLKIPGIGEQKFLKYGSAILEVIENHVKRIKIED